MSVMPSKPIGQQVLEAMKGRVGRVRSIELVEATGLTALQVKEACRRLVDRGLMHRCWKGSYRLTPKGLKALVDAKAIQSGPEGPHLNLGPSTSLRARLWRAARLMHSRPFGVAELMVLAGKEGEKPKEAQKYLSALSRCGFLTRLRSAKPCRFVLVRDTGPKPPQYTRARDRVFDPNTGKTYLVGAAHVD